MTQIKNRMAKYEYEILEEHTAGIVLVGSEIKSIRDGKVDIADAYCLIDDSGEAWIRNMSIEPYDNANTPHEVRRDRKLLLKKTELKKLGSRLIDKGLTLVPLALNVDQFVKVRFGLAKGKKQFDKRNTIKDRDNKRELDRTIKGNK